MPSKGSAYSRGRSLFSLPPAGAVFRGWQPVADFGKLEGMLSDALKLLGELKADHEALAARVRGLEERWMASAFESEARHKTKCSSVAEKVRRRCYDAAAPLGAEAATAILSLDFADILLSG